MMNLKYSNIPPLPKRSNREQLDELVRSGYRPYLCGDTGYGVVIAWAQPVYKYVDLAGERGFLPERHSGWTIPTLGLVLDEDASLQRVADAIGCSDVKRAPIEASLEYLLSSSIKLVVDDFGNLLLKPLLMPVQKIA